MGAVQPRFQVCEDEMDDWQILLSDLRIAAFRDGKVFVAALAEPGVAAPVVGDERRARHNGTLDEAAERLRASVWHDGESNTPGIAVPGSRWRTSTALTTRTLSWTPRPLPRVRPPTQVSSTSTCSPGLPPIRS